MPVLADGWVPNMFDRQFEVFNSKARALLVCGPRLSGKTLACIHKIARHLWETPGARVAMFSRTLKNSKDGGTWDDLTKIILPEWFESGIGMHYTTKGNDRRPGWKVDGQTRTPYFRVTNMHGGESELKLFSLDVDDQIEAKIKEQRFSMIYFSELSKFKDRRVLTIALPQLRMVHLRMDEQQWIADTNPSDEGDLSWIYQVWYRERLWTYEEYVASRVGQAIMKQHVFENFRDGLQLIEIRPDENPFLPIERLEELQATYAYDEGLYARYVDGKWIYGDGDSSRHFRGTFNAAVHVFGKVSEPNEEDWEYLNPTGGCFEIITGWDPGETNSAMVFIEKIENFRKPIFCILDEHVLLHQETSTQEFTEGVMDKLKQLETVVGHELITERAWSDRSAIEKYSATADTFQYLEVLAASEERFFLRGVPKGDGSIRVRVRLLKRLLYEKRIRISAHCRHTIQMLKDLKKGKDEFVPMQDERHVFDAITYALLIECAEELEAHAKPTSSRRSLDIEVSLFG